MLYVYSAGRYTIQHSIIYVCCMFIQQVVIQHNILSLTYVVCLFSRSLYNTTYYHLRMLYVYLVGRYTTQHTIIYVWCMFIQQVVMQHNILSFTYVVCLFSRSLYNTTYYHLRMVYVYSAGRYATQHTIIYVCCMFIQQVVIQHNTTQHNTTQHNTTQHTITHVCCMFIQ